MNVLCVFYDNFGICYMVCVLHYMICTAQKKRISLVLYISGKELEFFIREWEHECEKVATDSEGLLTCISENFTVSLLKCPNRFSLCHCPLKTLVWQRASARITPCETGNVDFHIGSRCFFERSLFDHNSCKLLFVDFTLVFISFF